MKHTRVFVAAIMMLGVTIFLVVHWQENTIRLSQPIAVQSNISTSSITKTASQSNASTSSQTVLICGMSFAAMHHIVDDLDVTELVASAISNDNRNVGTLEEGNNSLCQFYREGFKEGTQLDSQVGKKYSFMKNGVEHQIIPVTLTDEYIIDLTDRTIYVINGIDGSIGKPLGKF